MNPIFKVSSRPLQVDLNPTVLAAFSHVCRVVLVYLFNSVCVCLCVLCCVFVCFMLCVNIQYPVPLAGVCMLNVGKCTSDPGAVKL